MGHTLHPISKTSQNPNIYESNSLCSRAGYAVGSPVMFPGVPNTGNGSYGLSNSPYTPPVFPTPPVLPPPTPVAAYPPVQYSNNYNAYNNQQYIPYPVQYVGNVIPQIDGSTTRRVVGFSHFPLSYISVMQERLRRLSCCIILFHPFQLRLKNRSTNIDFSRPAIDPGTAFFHCAYPGCAFFSEHQSDIVHHWKVHFPPYEPQSCSSKSCRHKKRHAIEHKERLHDHIGKILGKPK